MPTLEMFKQFCLEQGNLSYDYIDFNNCAFAQFLKSLGYRDIAVSSCDFKAESLTGYFSDSMADALVGFSSDSGWTFDQLLERLEIVENMYA